MTVYFYRARGSQESWTDGENEVLRQLYPYADRAVILKALPMRTWKSAIMQANEIGVDRLTRENTSHIPVHMCFADCGLIRELGMEPGESVGPVMTPGVQDEPVNVDYPIDLHTLVKELRELIAA